MKKASATSGVALAAFVILVWSATFVNTKALLADFSALEILAIRFALAWVALWAIHPHGMGPLRVRDEALFAAAGLGGATVYQMLENEICYRCTGTERPEGISCPRRRNGRCF